MTLRYLWFPWLLFAALATPSGSRRPHVIAPISTVLPSGLQDSSSQALFDSLVAIQLTGAGFVVLPPAATDSVWRETVRAAGGYFDPHTGLVVPEKLWAARTATLERLQGTLAADALLFPEIKVVKVHYYRSWAVWDSVSERVLLDEGSGEVPALTLQVVVTEADGRPRYCGRGGIQVLVKGNLLHGPRGVKPEKLFRNSERNGSAVQFALQPLVQDHPCASP